MFYVFFLPFISCRLNCHPSRAFVDRMLVVGSFLSRSTVARRDIGVSALQPPLPHPFLFPRNRMPQESRPRGREKFKKINKKEGGEKDGNCKSTSGRDLPPIAATRRRRARGGAHDPTQRHLGRVLLGVVQVLAVVPEPRREDLSADRHAAGPSCATTCFVFSYQPRSNSFYFRPSAMEGLAEGGCVASNRPSPRKLSRSRKKDTEKERNTCCAPVVQ